MKVKQILVSIYVNDINPVIDFYKKCILKNVPNGLII